MAPFALRPASTADADFLVDMLVEAVNWHPERSWPRARVLADPAMAHYVNGWMRPGDLGVIAVAPAGVPIGAVWLRHFPAADAGYGYVRDDVPELSMGVVEVWRRRGVGRALLRGVLAAARSAGVPAVSLSVERANVAARLYVAAGFRTVASFEDADTMLAEL